jgi:hypothetical protein
MRLWLKPVQHSTSLTLCADTRAVLKRAMEAADKASAGSNLSIKVKLHLSLREKSHFRGTSMNLFTQPESQSQQGSG